MAHSDRSNDKKNLRVGPLVETTTKRYCDGCQYYQTEDYYEEDGNSVDSGTYHRCAHPQMPKPKAARFDSETPAECPVVASAVADVDAAARALFEKNAAGYRNKTPWEELHEDTRQLWRDEAKKRAPASSVADMVPLGTISECPSCGGEGKLPVAPGSFGPCWRCGGSGRVMAYRETEEQFRARMKKLGAFVAGCNRDAPSAITDKKEKS